MRKVKINNSLSMRVHLVNAIAWAGIVVAIGNSDQELTLKAASILVAGFMLDMLLLMAVVGDLKTRESK